MSKPINVIITDAVKKGAVLFNDGTISEAPTRIDVMVALIVLATKGELASRSKEVVAAILPHEAACKYAKPVEAPITAYLKAQF